MVVEERDGGDREGSEPMPAGGGQSGRDVVPNSGEVGEVWCRGPTVFAGAFRAGACKVVKPVASGSQLRHIARLYTTMLSTA